MGEHAPTPQLDRDPVTAFYLTELRGELAHITRGLDELAVALWCIARIQVEQATPGPRHHGQAALALINAALERHAAAAAGRRP